MDRKFPALLDPGQSLIFHPLSIEAIINNYECPCDDKQFHDPFVHFGVVDSFNRFYTADAKRIRFMLGIEKNYKKPCFIEKIKAFFTKRSLIKSYKNLNP